VWVGIRGGMMRAAIAGLSVHEGKEGREREMRDAAAALNVVFLSTVPDTRLSTTRV
jgi:hypothetical protein